MSVDPTAAGAEKETSTSSAALDRRAILLDRHPVWMAAVEQILNAVGITVAARTTSASDALRLAKEQQPHLFITDTDLEGGAEEALALVADVSQCCTAAKIIVLSSANDPSLVQAAFDAGASAYAVKTAPADDLASAIRQSFDNSIYFPRPAAATPAADNGSAANLTPRERDILRLAAEGHSNADLARMLWVSDQTVKFHLSNIYRKLGVTNRTEASRWAQIHGLVGQPGEPPDPRSRNRR